MLCRLNAGTELHSVCVRLKVFEEFDTSIVQINVARFTILALRNVDLPIFRIEVCNGHCREFTVSTACEQCTFH